ncbi:hypothetical protein PHYBOEH_010362 [Phytophthora boehmeriae]|uniref:Uncharacterized protein n=1 Tax=Phytophthora boehmeriae TaxID=109152 RepID=A0A8T1X342_9STRA|nr:hypothetical protein PHYBOEH_010362 [Phytophthora boehmeriae]
MNEEDPFADARINSQTAIVSNFGGWDDANASITNEVAGSVTTQSSNVLFQPFHSATDDGFSAWGDDSGVTNQGNATDTAFTNFAPVHNDTSFSNWSDNKTTDSKSEDFTTDFASFSDTDTREAVPFTFNNSDVTTSLKPATFSAFNTSSDGKLEQHDEFSGDVAGTTVTTTTTTTEASFSDFGAPAEESTAAATFSDFGAPAPDTDAFDGGAERRHDEFSGDIAGTTVTTMTNSVVASKGYIDDEFDEIFGEETVDVAAVSDGENGFSGISPLAEQQGVTTEEAGRYDAEFDDIFADPDAIQAKLDRVSLRTTYSASKEGFSGPDPPEEFVSKLSGVGEKHSDADIEGHEDSGVEIRIGTPASDFTFGDEEC